jgi:NAD-dependent SIR2 family protein deacetylase
MAADADVQGSSDFALVDPDRAFRQDGRGQGAASAGGSVVAGPLTGPAPVGAIPEALATARPPTPEALDALVELLRGRRVAMLTGAGVSTESGIPDYRGPETRRKARKPVRFAKYVGDEKARRRYWARSAIGWPKFRLAKPNAGHQAIAALEEAGRLGGLITQNVDRLHQKAGSRQVVELHGALAEVRCLDCGVLEDRDRLQDRLLQANPGLSALEGRLAPDGDADAEPEAIRTLVVPVCLSCGGGTLKPNVVFFGENVARAIVEESYRLVDEADVLLVAGSSLAVFSGYRFVRRAAAAGKPVAIVNLGETRGDPYATLRVEAPTGLVLPALAAALA